MTTGEIGCSEEVERILGSELPDLDKLTQAFGCITGFVVDYAGHELELARALQDQEQVVRIQIKWETMKHARSIFESCYRRIAGRRPWNESA